MLSMPEADFVTGFNVVWHSQDTELRKHVRFVMNTKHGVRSIATLHVSCQPGHHINARVEMDQLGYAHFIQGEVGRARAKPLGELPELRGHLVDPHHQADLLLNGADGVISAENRDEEFHSKFHWTDLGGSSAGSQYLKAVDEEGIPSVTPCLPNDESRAHEICSKHFGGPDDAFFSDCVFDVCAGGGEISAELLAAIDLTVGCVSFVEGWVMSTDCPVRQWCDAFWGQLRERVTACGLTIGEWNASALHKMRLALCLVLLADIYDKWSLVPAFYENGSSTYPSFALAEDAGNIMVALNPFAYGEGLAWPRALLCMTAVAACGMVRWRCCSVVAYVLVAFGVLRNVYVSFIFEAWTQSR
eukprot:symbB.v1.2.011109.t1/scaffold729.1/size168447/12